MGIINANNTLSFKSSESLFARIKKRLTSIDSQGLIDDGDFHKHIAYFYSLLGESLFKECQAVVHVKNYKAKLPPNFHKLYAAYKCTPYYNEPKTINEQRPLIFYSDIEIGCEKSDTRCCITCAGDTRNKIVVRNYVVGEPSTCYTYRNPVLLNVSPNVRDRCSEDCLSIIPSAMNEITFDGEGNILTNFDNDSIYLQYFGTPLDDNGLPMIPTEEIVEKAIEYYIYTQLFEELLWNSSVANIGQMLQDVRNQYNTQYFPQALYWAKLPSFNAMVNATRRMRSKNKFYYFNVDKTISYNENRRKC